MAKKKTIAAWEYTCGGCGKWFLVREDDEAPHGFHGTVVLINESGGFGGPFFACSVPCIQAAVVGAEDDQG